jgi:hypothetical protein
MSRIKTVMWGAVLGLTASVSNAHASEDMEPSIPSRSVQERLDSAPRVQSAEELAGFDAEAWNLPADTEDAEVHTVARQHRDDPAARHGQRRAVAHRPGGPLR